jgi:hypothetical protein
MAPAQDIIGDVAELSLQTLVVPATQTGTGASKTGHFKLAANADLKHYIDGHATVNIVGEIQLEITGPVSSTVATTAIVALYPDKYTTGPTTRAHVAALEGRVNIQHSLLVGSVLAAPKKAREVGESLKVKTLVDFPPVVAYHVDIAGGDATSAWTLTAHVPIAVGGVSHRKTWT